METTDDLTFFASSARSTFLSLTQDGCSVDSCFIEADSLFCHGASAPWVTKEPTLSLLALVCNAERFLRALLDRGFSFVIIFFDSHATIWNNSPPLAFARRALKTHLQAHLPPSCSVASFATPDDQAFAEYLRQSQPPLVFLVLEPQSLFGGACDSPLLMRFARSCLVAGVRCVTMGELAFDARAVAGFCWTLRNPALPQAPPPAPQAVAAQPPVVLPPNPLAQAGALLEQAPWLAHEQQKPLLAILALRLTMLHHDSELLARIALATLLLQAQLPLRLRLQPPAPLDSHWTAGCRTFENAFFRNALVVLDSWWAGPLPALHDFFDSHLLRLLLARALGQPGAELHVALGIPASFLPSLQAVWAFVVPDECTTRCWEQGTPAPAGPALVLPPAPPVAATPVTSMAPPPLPCALTARSEDLDSWEDLAVSESPAPVPAPAPVRGGPLLLPVAHPLLARLRALDDLPTHDPASLPAEVRELLVGSSRFEERHHWHSLRLLESAAFTPQDHWYREQYKRSVLELRGYADSLASAVNVTRAVVRLPPRHLDVLAKVRPLVGSDPTPALVRAALKKALTHKAYGLWEEHVDQLYLLLALEACTFPLTAAPVTPPRLPNAPVSGELQQMLSAKAMPGEAAQCSAELAAALGFRPPALPDPWQVRLMQAVERGSSLLVCAPTSSGKTFIAFHAIEQVLRESDDGVVVFVCPTKALVQQVYAEVQSRFRKVYPHEGTQHMVGIFNSSHRVHPDKCQVLVTVPQCLEILLLSPHHNRFWRNKLRWVIFDEIHQMNEDQGVVWEHLLLLIPCPFIALSATIGNEHEFAGWLRRVDPNLVVVSHAFRYTDLRYHSFTRQTRLRDLHPLSCLPWEARHLARLATQLENLPPMNPDSLLAIWAALAPITADGALHPDAFFGSPQEVTRKRLHEYDQALRSALRRALADDQAWPLLAARFPGSVLPVPDATEGTEGVAHLVLTLRREKLLPAIVFNFSKKMCEQLALACARRLPPPEAPAPPERAALVQKLAGQFRQFATLQPLIRLLDRGIGVHHAALPASYLQLVERLFRERKLDLIFATGTLAMGVHMPCRTVVISSDSPHLNATLFRQMAGRAGRRGYDAVGHVVVHNLTPERVKRLLTAPAASIQGHMPVTPTYTLRLMMLASQASDKEAAINACVRLVRQPFFVLGRERNMQLTEHHWRFNIEYLAQRGYINGKGEPQGFSGLLAHLWYREPANFVLVEFLRAGLFHALLDQDISSDTIKEQILLVLCYLLVRTPMHPWMARRAVRGAKSLVILPPLPPAFAAHLEEYNRSLLRFAHNYLAVVAAAIPPEPLALPLSGLRWADEEPTSAAWPAYRASARSVQARGVFFAIGNASDQFGSLQELLATARGDVYLDEASFPEFHHLDARGEDLPLNAFGLDFYKHGDRRALEELNLLSVGDADKALNELLKALCKVQTSLRLMRDTCADPACGDEKFLATLATILSKLRQKITGAADAQQRKCKDFARAGFCKWGEHCRYRH